jgi:N6-adenosine-specific RNA methylase IME4
MKNKENKEKQLNKPNKEDVRNSEFCIDKSIDNIQDNACYTPSQIDKSIYKKYDLIYADPAWNFQSNSISNPGRNVRKEYETMHIDKIAKLPVKRIAKNDCMLAMWITTPLLNKIDQILKPWGFKYCGVLFTWIKLNKKSQGIFLGMGYVTRKNTEICIYGKRGKGIGSTNRRDISELIISKRREHSRKPEEAYRKLELLYPTAEKVELFARNHRNGWDSWGNEIESTVEFTKLSNLKNNGGVHT